MSAPPTSSTPPPPAPAAYRPQPPAPAPYGAPGAAYGPRPQGPSGGSPLPPAPPRPLTPPPPPAPRRRRPSAFVGLVSLGLVIVLVGMAVALADPLGLSGEPAVLGLALALGAVSAVVLGLGLSGRAAGFSGFLVIVLGFVTAIAGIATQVPSSDGVGDRVWTPLTTSTATDYSLGAGSATLDLAALADTPTGSAPRRISADLGAGELRIDVPPGLDVRVETEIGFGEIRHERIGSTGLEVLESRTGDDLTYTARIGDDTPDVVVHAEVGLGDIVIEEN